MHATGRYRPSALLSPVLVLAMIVATLAAGSSAAGAATSAAGAAKQSVRTISRGLSLSFPTNQRVGTVNGVQSPEFRPPESEGGDEGLAAARASGPQRFRKRASGSLSVRPTSKTAALRAAAAGLSVPNVKPTRVDTARPGLRRSFEGLNHFDQRTANNGNQFSIEPPDQGLCVGNGFVLETVNTVLQVYDTRGNALSPVTDLNSFYGYPAQINRTTGAQGPFITDPSCLFDKATNRFFHVVLTLEVDPATGNFTGANHLDLAVSQTSSPLGAWNIYQLPVQDDGTQGTPTHVDCPCVGDYPHIGADKFGFYITTNEYPFSDDPGLYGNNYNGAQIYAFSKGALAAGAASVNVVQFESPELGDGTPSFTVWPAQFNPGGFVTSGNGTEYFLQTSAAEETLNEEGMDNRVGFWKLTNSASLDTASPAPRLSSAILGSETYGVPPLSEQKGGSVPLRDCLLVECIEGIGPSPGEVEGPLDSLDSRMQQTWFANGRLYGAFGTIANVAGNIKAAIAWVVVDPFSPRIASQGYVGVAANNVIMPAVAVLSSGKGALAFTLVGTRHFPSAGYVAVSGGRVSGNVHVAGRGAGPQDGFSEYTFFNGAGTDPPRARPRWGDYGAAVTQGDSLFLASEWIGQTCTFSTYVQDTTCGATRTALANWSTRLSVVRP